MCVCVCACTVWFPSSTVELHRQRPAAVSQLQHITQEPCDLLGQGSSRVPELRRVGALWTCGPGERAENDLQASGLLPLRGRVQGQLSGVDPVSSHTRVHTLQRTD